MPKSPRTKQTDRKLFVYERGTHFQLKQVASMLSNAEADYFVLLLNIFERNVCVAKFFYRLLIQKTISCDCPARHNHPRLCSMSGAIGISKTRYTINRNLNGLLHASLIVHPWSYTPSPSTSTHYLDFVRGNPIVEFETKWHREWHCMGQKIYMDMIE